MIFSSHTSTIPRTPPNLQQRPCVSTPKPCDRATALPICAPNDDPCVGVAVIPDFMTAIDNAQRHLAEDGIVGVADFFTSAKYDLPSRQHSYLQRWFWRSMFDVDGIDLGPERRLYLEHRFEPVYEYNSRGKIPYLPVVQAPYYQWIGKRRDYTKKNLDRFPARASDEFEAKRPPAFPPTFLYSLSWEDPREDDKFLNIDKDDTVLTLTSGGCNALDQNYLFIREQAKLLLSILTQRRATCLSSRGSQLSGCRLKMCGPCSERECTPNLRSCSKRIWHPFSVKELPISGLERAVTSRMACTIMVEWAGSSELSELLQELLVNNTGLKAL